MRYDAYKRARSFQYKIKHGLIKKEDDSNKNLVPAQIFNDKLEENTSGI